VLKGALKPTCLSDTESEMAGYSWMNAALGTGSGMKRQLSESSAHRSVLVVVLVGVVVVVFGLLKHHRSPRFS